MKVYNNYAGGLDLVDTSMVTQYSNLSVCKKDPDINPSLLAIGKKDNLYLPKLPSYNNISRRFEEKTDDYELLDSIANKDANLLLPTSVFNGVDTSVTLPEAFNFTVGKFIEMDIDLGQVVGTQHIFAYSTSGLNYNGITNKFLIYSGDAATSNDTYIPTGGIIRLKIERLSKNYFNFYVNDTPITYITGVEFNENTYVNVIGARGDGVYFFNGNMHNINFNNELFIPLPHLGIGFKADNSVVNLTLSGEFAEDYVEGGCDWMQKYGAIEDIWSTQGIKVGDTNLYTPSSVEGKTFEIWSEAISNNSAYQFIISSADVANKFTIVDFGDALFFKFMHDELTVYSRLFTQKRHHIVFSISDTNIFNLWVDGSQEMIDFDTSANPLTDISTFARNGKYYFVKEYNFKPTDEQITEWYNGGRVSEYQLPASYYDTSSTEQVLHEYLGPNALTNTSIDTGTTPENQPFEGELVNTVFGKKYVPNNQLGQPIRPLAATDERVIYGDRFMNETPAMIDFLHTNIATDAEIAFFDKSNALIWSDEIRSNQYYNEPTPYRWHTSEVNQPNIFDNCLDKYRLWIKLVNGSYKDIFLYVDALEGDDISKVEKYVKVKE